MVTVKNLLNGAATAALGALALQNGARAQGNQARAGAIDGLKAVAEYDNFDSGYDYNDYSDAPGPAVTAPAPGPALPFADNTTVPCVEVEFLAALELLIVDLDPASASSCANVSEFNNDVFSSLEGAFGPGVVTSNPFVEGVYANLDEQLQSIANFTNSTSACDNVTTYNTRVETAVNDMFDTLSLLQNVTECEPYIN